MNGDSKVKEGVIEEKYVEDQSGLGGRMRDLNGVSELKLYK